MTTALTIASDIKVDDFVVAFVLGLAIAVGIGVSIVVWTEL